MKTGIYWQDPKYPAKGMDFIFDPSLVLYLPLHQLDGASFMSKDTYGHLCTVTGALWKPQGRLFDGSDDVIDIGTISGITSVYTISLWVNSADAPVGASEHFLGGTTLQFEPDFGLDTNSKIRIVGNSLDSYLTSAAALTSATWYMITAVMSGKYKGLYINGSLDKEETGPTYTAGWDAAGHLIGAYNSPASSFFDGTIGEAWVYNRALSVIEIQRNYLATKWRYQ